MTQHSAPARRNALGVYLSRSPNAVLGTNSEMPSSAAFARMVLSVYIIVTLWLRWRLRELVPLLGSITRGSAASAGSSEE